MMTEYLSFHMKYLDFHLKENWTNLISLKRTLPKSPHRLWLMILFQPLPHQELIYQKRRFRAKRPRNVPPCTLRHCGSAGTNTVLPPPLQCRRRYCAAASPYSRPWPWPLPRPWPRRLLLHASTSAF